MTPSYAFAGPKPKLIAVLIAALGALVAAGLTVPSAAPAASSGGISTEEEKSAATSAKYERLWTKVSKRERRWARRTARCESGGDPKAIGGGGKYRGAFQFLRSTWRRSPKSPRGDPIRYPYRTQAVVAVALKKRDGSGHWPNCG